MKSKFVKLFLLALICVISVSCTGVEKNDKSLELPVRTVELAASKVDYQAILDSYEDSKLEVNNNVVSFEGNKTFTLDESILDNVSEDTVIEESFTVRYYYHFNVDDMTITIYAALDKNDETLIDEIVGDVFINDSNEIDALFDLEGESILLSEMIDAGLIEECGWFKNLARSVLKVVQTTVVGAAAGAVVGTVISKNVYGTVVGAVVGAVAVCACSVTQTIKANTNLSHNKQQFLHSDVDANGFITDQDYYTDWKFGYEIFKECGCEVIATYNAMVALGKKKELYDVIYDFEMLNIDYDIGFGKLGSNPDQIYRYLNRYGVEYDKYNNIDKLIEAANKIEGEAYIIFSSKNYTSVLGIHSIHTFMIKKDASGQYKSFNGYDDDNSYSDLNNFVKYDYITAYIVRD